MYMAIIELVHHCLGNGLSPIQCHAITVTNDKSSSIERKYEGDFNKDTITFIQENTFQNFICTKSSILSQSQFIKPVPTRKG